MKKLLKRTLGTVRELKRLIKGLEIVKGHTKKPNDINTLLNICLGMEIIVENLIRNNIKEGDKR